ncbi:DUF3516 domain-containing protein, partial [Microbispora triticiradicis]|uniref:DUF3516 domain-containing protein n=1 Tax=Microbispora triticiradicis TaxID=2200763 RepID=UPI001AD7BA8E
GFDTVGYVVCQAPDYVIENERALAKIGDDPKRRRGYARKKPPEGFVGWSEDTFEKLQTAEPEPLTSRFKVSNAMLLSIINRPGDCFQAMKRLLTDNHEDRKAQRRHISHAIAIYRSLLAGGIVEKLAEPDEHGRMARLTVDLQEDFALNQALATFALASFELLDRASPTYALDLVSIVESTLDDPRQILHAQLNKARGEAVAQMKADGIEYEERMERLAEITHPMPLADLLFGAYETYRRGHPWVGDHVVSPKTIVRDMYERAMTFTEYIQFYELARSEGTVLRYLADAYRTLSKTVPEHLKTDDLVDLIEWLGELVRQVDSSLIDEWEKLANPAEALAAGQEQLETRTRPVTANARAFRVLVRNAMFRLVELAALDREEELTELYPDVDWGSALDAYYEEHDEILTGPDARGPALLLIEEEKELWRVRQIVDDPAGNNDWGISAEVDLAASDEEGHAVLHVTGLTRL